MARDIHPRHRALFYRQLAQSLKAGLSTQEALQLVGRDSGPSGRRARSVQEMVQDPSVDLGQALAAQEADGVLGPARAMQLRSAYETGRLDQTLDQLADAADQEARTRHETFWSVGRYVLVLALVPVTLAAPMIVTHGLAAYFTVVVPCLLILAGLMKLGIEGGRQIPAAFRRLPLVGPWAREEAMARASLCLHQFFNAGFAPPAALRAAARVAGPGRESRVLRRMADQVERGAGLAEAVDGTDLPPLFVQFLKTGERTGDLAELTERAWRHHAEEAARRRKTCIVVLGAAVLVVAAAIAGYVVATFWLGHFEQVMEATEA